MCSTLQRLLLLLPAQGPKGSKKENTELNNSTVVEFLGCMYVICELDSTFGRNPDMMLCFGINSSISSACNKSADSKQLHSDRHNTFTWHLFITQPHQENIIGVTLC